MGSRSNKHDLAYIAGFLDGDGSLMLQVKKRSDTKRGIRFMATICLYQDTRHEEPLHWIRDVFGIGYVSQRCDGMSELRVNGFRQVREILQALKPFIRFKKLQTEALIKACSLLEKNSLNVLTQTQLKKLLTFTMVIRNENYASHTRGIKSEEELRKLLGLTP